jgi:hypothetical protein
MMKKLTFERLRLTLAVVALLVAALATACASPSSGAPVEALPVATPALVPQVIAPAVAGLTATLEDQTTELPGGRMAWSTYWKLCWASYPGAVAYELQALTGEGAASKLQRQSASCFRIEAAAGENEQAQGLLNRELLLALQTSQLAYRVRAALDDQRVSAWSPALAVGEATGATAGDHAP